MIKHTTVYWLILLPVLLLTSLAVLYIAPHLAHSVPLSETAKAFSYINFDLNKEAFKPESLEHVRYVLAIALVPLLFSGFLALGSRIPRFSQTGTRFATGATLLVQAALVGFIVFNLMVLKLELASSKISGTPSLICLGLGIVLIALLFWQMPKLEKIYHRKWTFWSAGLAGILIIVYSGLRLLPVLFSDVDATNGSVGFHYSFIVNEYQAVANGRTILVNYFPQYHTLLPTLFGPFLNWIGFSFIHVTGYLLALNIVIFACAYYALYQLTKKHQVACMLFIPFFATACHPFTVDVSHQVYYTFNYYAMGPLRYLGPFLVLFFLCRYLIRPTEIRALILFFVGGLATINNVDFGFPALVGAYVATLAVLPGSPWWEKKAFFKHTGLFFSGVTTAIILFLGLTFLRSGQLPDFAHLFIYQKIFAIYGFFMLPMTNWGMQWVFYMTYMACCITGIILFAKKTRESSSHYQLRLALLLYTGIAASGAFMYYVGRSHEHVLTGMFLFLAFALTLLIIEGFLDLRHLRYHFPKISTSDKLVRVIPMLVLAYTFLMLCSNIKAVPTPKREFKRINTPISQEHIQWEKGIVNYIKSHTHPGEAVEIVGIYSFGDALKAGVVNVSPFTGLNSYLSNEQFDMAIDAVHKNNVHHVFGPISGALSIELTQHNGFTCEPAEGVKQKAIWGTYLHCHRP